MDMKKQLCCFLILPILIPAAAGCSKSTDNAAGNTQPPSSAAAVSETAPASKTDLDSCITDAVMEKNKGLFESGEFQTESHIVLGKDEQEHSATVYAMVLYEEYGYKSDAFQVVSGGHGPVAMTFDKKADGAYVLQEYWEPVDGDNYAASIREKFPKNLYERALDTQSCVQQQEEECNQKARDYFSSRKESARSAEPLA